MISRGLQALSAWRDLVAPPSESTAGHIDWPTVQRELGLPLPMDYKGYIDTFGLGCVNRLFWVLHPYSSEPILNLRSRCEIEADPELHSGMYKPPPHPVRLDFNSLIPCAVNEDLAVVYWHTVDRDPDKWNIIVRDEDGGSWTPLNLSIVGYLLALFTGQMNVGYAQYITETIEFSPNPFRQVN